MGMILLVTDCPRGAQCAAALQRSTGERVEIIKSVRRCAQVLHDDKLPVSSLIAVVVDSALIESESSAAEELLERADTALPIIINLAISGIDRVVREVKLALQRYSKQRQLAMQTAESILRGQLRSTITGILLSTQLALEVPSLPPEAEFKMRAVHQLALNLRDRLESQDTASVSGKTKDNSSRRDRRSAERGTAERRSAAHA